ncbi:MAG TPA: cytochrome c oxidase subunit II [Candidatus Cybelea sp.]|nr:cytochrome c oxidase subunit II [Candidatus Cybelea sp.]
MSWFRVLAACGLAISAALVGFDALAAGGPLGQPHEWQFGLQDPVTPVKEQIESFHNLLLIIITAITLFVMGLLLYVIVRFGAARNPVPSRTAHNTLIEVMWTILPIMILIVIAIPSFKLLYFSDRVPKAEMTIKATGHQWYWSYEYPDNGNFGFDAILIQDSDLKQGQLRLLETDNRVVVPVDTTVRVIVTAADVLHAWFVPSFGVQKEGVPGRANETWFKAEKIGTFYGQCSELCGQNHGFMPIVVQVVSKDDFTKWAADAKKKFSAVDAPSARVAAAAE